MINAFFEKFTNWVKAYQSKLVMLSPLKIAIWGAGAKGVTFCNLIDPNRTLIECVIDINPAKQGHFIPGTGHKIIAPGECIQKGITQIFLMNPNYKNEIKKTVNCNSIEIFCV